MKQFYPNNEVPPIGIYVMDEWISYDVIKVGWFDSKYILQDELELPKSELFYLNAETGE